MTAMRAFRIPRALLLSCALLASPAMAAICRVTPAGSAFNDGSSWAVPVSLKQALLAPAICTEVWVAAGVYKPGAAGAPSESFNIANGVQVYGGFAGVETAREQRNASLNLTVLSGDIDNNDTAVNGVVESASGISGTNTNSVVRMANVGSGTVLDGFTITAGYGAFGAGLACSGQVGTCNPTLSHLVFSGNAALIFGSLQFGGALCNLGVAGGVASPALSDVRFRGNRAGTGGAMGNFVSGGTSNPSLTRVTFEDNISDGDGGALYNDGGSQASLSDVVFEGNTSQGNGGALYNDVGSQPSLTRIVFEGNTSQASGGALYNAAGSNPMLSDVTFVNNGAVLDGGALANNGSNTVVSGAAFIDNSAGRNGGAIANLGTGLGSPLTNVTFRANEGVTKGGAIYNYNSSPTLTNVTLTANIILAGSGGGMFSEADGSSSAPVVHNAVFWDNLAPLGQPREVAFLGGGTATFDHSIVKGSGGSAAWNPAFGVNAGSNLDVDPKLGGLDDSIGFTRSISPAAGSPAIDAGSACPAEDQRGVVRPQGPQCDIGAVEVFAPIDLISHNGFEECWSPALARNVFLQRMQTAIDGRTICIPQYADTIAGSPVSACNTAACPGGAVGCPITLDVSPFGDGGNFLAGSFTATGSASDVAIPVTTQFRNCIFNATGIQTGNLVEYVLTADGNGGAYAALLNRISITATQYSLGSADSVCNDFADNVETAFVTQASAAIGAALRAPLQAVTLGELVCPLQ